MLWKQRVEVSGKASLGDYFVLHHDVLINSTRGAFVIIRITEALKPAVRAIARHFRTPRLAVILDGITAAH